MWACDPGLVSGVAIWRATEPPLLHAYEVRGVVDTAAFLDRCLQEWSGRHRVLVVCERFVITSTTHTKDQGNWSLELIGCHRYLASHRGAVFELQGAAEAKRFCPNERLEELGWYEPTRGNHAADAARHLVLALCRHRLISVELLGI